MSQTIHALGLLDEKNFKKAVKIVAGIKTEELPTIPISSLPNTATTEGKQNLLKLISRNTKSIKNTQKLM